MFHACFLAIWVSFRMPWLKNPSSHLADENDDSIPKFGKKYLQGCTKKWTPGLVNMKRKK